MDSTSFPLPFEVCLTSLGRSIDFAGCVSGTFVTFPLFAGRNSLEASTPLSADLFSFGLSRLLFSAGLVSLGLPVSVSGGLVSLDFGVTLS